MLLGNVGTFNNEWEVEKVCLLCSTHRCIGIVQIYIRVANESFSELCKLFWLTRRLCCEQAEHEAKLM